MRATTKLRKTKKKYRIERGALSFTPTDVLSKEISANSPTISAQNDTKVKDIVEKLLNFALKKGSGYMENIGICWFKLG